MDKFFNLFTSTNKRRKLTDSIFFKLGMGCLGVIFILMCLGGLLLVYFMPQ